MSLPKRFKLKFNDANEKNFVLEVIVGTYNHATKLPEGGIWKLISGKLKLVQGIVQFPGAGAPGYIYFYDMDHTMDTRHVKLSAVDVVIRGTTLRESGKAYLRKEWAVGTAGGNLTWTLVK